MFTPSYSTPLYCYSVLTPFSLQLESIGPGYRGLILTMCRTQGGSFDAPSGSCSLCPAGQYSDVTGLSQCLACPAGTYAGNTGNDELSDCISCSRGRYSSATGSAATCGCCPAGADTRHVGNTSAVACVACGAGKWRDATCTADNSPRMCIDCVVDSWGMAVGAVSAATACIPCPASSTTGSRSGVTALIGCWCEAGYQKSQGTCGSCPADTYKSEASPNQCLACPPNSVTQGVIGATSVSECVCIAGHAGLLSGCGTNCVVGDCAPCPAGFYKATIGRDDCVACPANAVSGLGSTALGDCTCATDL